VAEPAARRRLTQNTRFVDVSAENDAFQAFKTELSARKDRPRAAAPPPVRERRHPKLLRLVLSLLVAAPITAGVVSWLQRPDRPAAAGATGAVTAPPPAAPAVPAESSVTIKSLPEGATVLIDGRSRGVTPLKLSLPVGRHTVELRNGAASRTLPLDVEAGVAATQYIEIESAATVPTAVGRLEVLSEPAGAQVMIDGVARGVAPLTISNLAVGQHRVSLKSASSTFNRLVTIAPGATATVVASLARASVSVGWVVVDSPLELQVFEGGRRLGTGLDRIMLPAGTHTFDLVNEQYAYRTTATIEVTPGDTTTARIDVPLGRISVNATPWAEVSIDGRSVGTTPLAHLSVPIGLHEVVWRHPQFGERRQVVSVTAAQPVRLGMDFNQ
jgi:hypothetical protein